MFSLTSLFLVVVRSKCPSYVGLTGILVQELKHVFKVITKEDQLKGMCVNIHYSYRFYISVLYVSTQRCHTKLLSIRLKEGGANESKKIHIRKLQLTIKVLLWLYAHCSGSQTSPRSTPNTAHFICLPISDTCTSGLAASTNELMS